MQGIRLIVKKLRTAGAWLESQRGKPWRREYQVQVNLLVQACVFLLAQSIRDYGEWPRRRDHAAKINGLYNKPPNNRALRDLLELAATDLEANELFQPQVVAPWQLESVPTGRYTCKECGEEFGASRTAKFCSAVCRAAHSRKTALPPTKAA